MRRGLTCLTLLATSLSALAQEGTVTLQFSNEGEREVWVGTLNDPGAKPTPQPVSGRSVVLPVASAPPNPAVFVHEKATGAVSVKALPAIRKEGGTWKVLPQDASRVFKTEFLVRHEGKPVASSLIIASAGKETRQVLAQGQATLYCLPEGPLTVKVQYTSDGASKTTPAETFDIKIGQAGRPRILTISDKVDTVPEPQAQAQAQEPAVGAPAALPPAPSAPNPVATFVNLLLGLAVVGGLGYGIYWFVKQNPKQVTDALKSVGLGQQAAAPAQDPPAVPSQPEPIKPIVLGSAAQTGLGAPMTPVAANPRLVADNGDVFLLPEGASEAGRERTPILVAETGVSRRHARFDRAGNSVTVTDLGSTNGTFVNGMKVDGTVALSPGDTVQLGPARLRFEV